MNKKNKEIFDKLYKIYNKHRKKYPGNPDSRQLCCMWSTTNPPDIIEDTPPFHDIEESFNILIDEDDCLELYDMDLAEATDKILNMIEKQC